MPPDSDRAEVLIRRALGLPDATLRAALLDRECAADPELSGWVEDLRGLLDWPDATWGRVFRAGRGAASPPDVGPRAARPADLAGLVGATIAGRYRVLRPIGDGGPVAVYLAEQFRPARRPVALKLVRAGAGSLALRDRFDAERRALALLDHPHVARALDAGATADGSPFLVMELAGGVPLADFCAADRPGRVERLQLFVAICDAVEHAHRRGVVHRDLRPAHILVERRDGRPEPKVIGFGLATLAPGGPSPEAAGDPRDDVNALGLILHELLAGPTPPRRAASLGAWVGGLLGGPGGWWRGRSSRRTLDGIVLGALSSDPGRRYASAGALARDVEHLLRQGPAGWALAAHPGASAPGPPR